MSVIKKIRAIFGLSIPKASDGEGYRTYTVRTRLVQTADRVMRVIPRSEIQRILLEDAIKDLPPEARAVSLRNYRESQIIALEQKREQRRQHFVALEQEISDLVEEIELGNEVKQLMAADMRAVNASVAELEGKEAINPETGETSLPALTAEERLRAYIEALSLEYRQPAQEFFASHPEMISIALDEGKTLRLGMDKSGKMYAAGIKVAKKAV